MVSPSVFHVLVLACIIRILCIWSTIISVFFCYFFIHGQTIVCCWTLFSY